MRRHCGNCANHRGETNWFSEECGKCVVTVLKNRQESDPSHWKAKPQTNADRIRAMSDEELLDTFGHLSLCDVIQYDFRDHCEKQAVCDGCLLEWLKQPAKEGE